jgi:DNA-binding MarR family transcriptional regulator
MDASLPLIERNSCNCAALRKASRLISQLYDAALAPCGLKSTQFAMLTEIGRRADEPPTIGDLAQTLVMDESTIGQNLRPLERDGLVSLQADAADRRRRHVQLTRKGRARLAAAQPLWSGAQARFEDSFGKHNAAKLRAVLLDIVRQPAFLADLETASSDA